jgi:tetratricopeptide (TPR) repeat protein
VNLVLVLLCWILSIGSVQAGEREAVEAYRRGEWLQAAEFWRAELTDPKLPAHCAERGRILHNLGNAAYRAERKFEAVAWYTMALEQRPRDASTWANLELARSECGLEPQDRGDLASTLGRAAGSWTEAEAGWIAVGGLLLTALALGFEALRGGRAGRLAVAAAFASLLLSLIPLAFARMRDPRPWTLCVERSPVPLRSEPREEAAGIADWIPGARGVRVDELPDWVKLELSDGTQGWVPRSSTFP